jgi:hypothetical protein
MRASKNNMTSWKLVNSRELVQHCRCVSQPLALHGSTRLTLPSSVIDRYDSDHVGMQNSHTSVVCAPGRSSIQLLLDTMYIKKKEEKGEKNCCVAAPATRRFAADHT